MRKESSRREPLKRPDLMKMRRESLSQVFSCWNQNLISMHNQRLSISEQRQEVLFVISFHYSTTDHDFAASLVCTTASAQDGFEGEEQRTQQPVHVQSEAQTSIVIRSWGSDAEQNDSELGWNAEKPGPTEGRIQQHSKQIKWFVKHNFCHLKQSACQMVISLFSYNSFGVRFFGNL